MNSIPGAVDIDDLVAEYERDPEMAARMKVARRKIAPLCYPNGGPQYERMMRGEGPPVRRSGDA